MRSPVRPHGLAVSAVAELALCACVLAGCAHRAPPSVRNDTAVISGRNTVHASANETMRTVLVEAAAITVDHGYRYFKLMAPVRPGADVPIRVFGAGEAPDAPNVYDADAIAAGRLPAPAR